jgi:DHA2 family multidrug resistance protein
LNQGSGAVALASSELSKLGLSQSQILAQLNRLIDQQAFTRAADDIFLASGWIFLTLIALIWFAQRPSKMAQAPKGTPIGALNDANASAQSGAH